MKYDFNEIIDRKNTNSLKYDFAKERRMPEDLLPLWVADMDFKTPPEVINALVEASNHGIFGYSDTKDDYFETLQNWFKTSFNWEVHKPWLVKTPGVVFAINTAIRAFTEEGDAVLIQKPVYYPFSSTVLLNGRILVNNSLVYNDGKYEIDFEDFEKKIIDNKVKLFLLCNPHNPVGRVLTKEELIKLGDICVKHNVIVVSDEIHADFIFKPYVHEVFANLKPEFQEISVTCTAPSKTFNLAGLQVSNIFIPNKDLKSRFKSEVAKTGYSQLNTLGLIACKVAYAEGRPWLEDLLVYLQGNLDFLRRFLNEKLPKVKLIEPQGTYLVWLDFNDLGFNEKELNDLIITKAKLWLDAGTMFDDDATGFQRINIACPRSILEKALLNLEISIKEV
ncbi:MalY/PatB family protein [Clostridium cellulovorans]|uniref:cysteine-S-conjugate beta-lyase n=1 Tax=Clostridium cellulovorans (strain ATCC 35296 / DSM 3052 / OCM 3 / 743B) TaxID=573061 RepID=D9SVU3_CLOC7|nr:MalY/PatB family protein [Clostridium cellulovorans]ADL53154.1 aminotransferase class I and II [Clostridium cellulovorans 743B]